MSLMMFDRFLVTLRGRFTFKSIYSLFRISSLFYGIIGTCNIDNYDEKFSGLHISHSIWTIKFYLQHNNFKFNILFNDM